MIETEKKQKLLSICITSYNRIEELSRCIKSVGTIYHDKIEIIVSEDHSEKREQIRKVVSELQKESTTEIRFNSNEENLGYDRNLQKLISLSKGKYILFLSDDDSIIRKSLDEIIELLLKNEYNMIFSSFILGQQKKMRYYSHSFSIEKGIDNIRRYVYDSILFSGLLFRRELISNIKGDRFVNCNYFQVYLFMYMILNYTTDYISIPLVQCNGDGENAFGKAASSNGNELLADRKSIFSNLEFHKGLIRVIRIFEKDFSVSIIPDFAKEYCLRAFTGMSLARAQGLQTYKSYWERLKLLDLPFTGTIYFYHSMLIVFGSKLSSLLLSIPKTLLIVIRERN